MKWCDKGQDPRFSVKAVPGGHHQANSALAPAVSDLPSRMFPSISFLSPVFYHLSHFPISFYQTSWLGYDLDLSSHSSSANQLNIKIVQILPSQPDGRLQSNKYLHLFTELIRKREGRGC